jgi:rare lipoprotein A
MNTAGIRLVPVAHGCRRTRALLLLVVLGLPACASRSNSPAAVPAANPQRILEAREGLASYYGPGFQGKLTASGVRFDMHEMVAAHPHYPFGTIVRVINLRNRRSVRVRILDRGPAPGPRAQGVVIDLSYAAARALRFIDDGRTRVRIEVLRWGR